MLAEDNAVNQILACEMLQSLGCVVDVANNGREAVAAAAQGRYDLILMDCQMPEMDGFEATRKLREAGLTVPIIAVTANAMRGDRERCLAAGMDDHLPKPFKKAQLHEILVQWLPRTSPIGTAQTAAIKSIDPEALASIRELQGDDDPDILRQVIGLYLETSPALLDAMENAVAIGNCPNLQSAAHTLKSASANMGARRLAALCSEIETEARSGRPGRSEDMAAILKEYQQVRLELESAGLAKG